MRPHCFKAIVPLVLGVIFLAISGRAAAFAAEAGIPPGTVITMQNWQQYKQFMPDGMQGMWAGNRFWKLPADMQMEIRATQNYEPPKPYLENTEKYSKQVEIVNLSNGGHSIRGYIAGLPFPNPAEPLR